MQQPVTLSRDLVLVGGGHAHALALRMLAMRPIDGLRITLISPASHTPYSGMLPGLLAGSAFALYIASINLTEVVRAILLFYMTPLWSTLLGVLVLRERLTANRIVALARVGRFFGNAPAWW